MENVPLKPKSRHSERRLMQIERVLRIADIISSRHFGITADDLRRELEEAGDRVCQRTIARYMRLFVDLGFASREEICPHGVRLIRYRFVRQLPRTLKGA